MGAIGLNPIRLDAIGLDPIRFNAIKLGVPGASSATDRPYISPDILSALAGVWISDGKSNTDPDRNIIKNKLPGRGGDFEILNAAYEGMSGCNGYPVVFGANKTWEHFSGTANYTSDTTSTTIHITHVRLANRGLLYSYVKENGVLTNIKEIPAFRVTVKGLEGNSKLVYKYLATKDATKETSLHLSNGTHKLAKSFVPTDALLDLTTNVWIGMYISPISEEVTEFDCDITIEVLPEYEGSFVTDGVNDMIVSQNTVEEMGITDEFTVVSMIHQITLRGATAAALTNYIRQPIGYEYVRNHVANIGKTGIYGYAVYDVNHSNANNSHVINTILGDKNDYSIHITGNLSQGKFSVQGYINGDNNIVELSQVAWYWTFIAKRVLTTDEINQVIAYYNLDKYVMPDIYYDVKKQGLTNDNHAQFGDKLIDYSGNGRDLQLFNIGWNPGSGIGKYVTNFGIWSKDAESKISYNSYSFTVNGSLKRTWLMWYVTELPSFKIKVSGINSNGYVDYGYYDNGSLKNFRLDKNGIHTLPPSGASSNGHGFKVNDTSLDWTGLVIEQIPDFAGALCFDGVDDFGINKDVPTFTDFTVIAKRTWLEENTSDKPFIIKGDTLYPDGNQNAFLFEYGKLSTYSFGQNNKYDESVVPSLISYATTYSYNGVIPLVRGSATDTIGIDVAHSTKIALYFLMLFPYSMSEFLIERQLKKHKLGTLYPNMVEFRPIIKSNIDILKINYWDKDLNVVKAGDYISIGSNIKTSITVLDGYKISKVSSAAFNNITIEKSNTDFIYDVIFYGIKKSPQKINLVIEQDSDYVQWNPNIKANVSKYSVTANIRETDGTTLKLVNGQFYSTSITGNLILDIVPPYKDSDEVTNVVIDGKSYVPTKDSSGNYYRLEIPLVFPKEINITIQEYVRYEDIVQPYPVLLRFKDENNNEISWGDKIKLGSSITRIGSFNDCNLLKDIYTVSNAKLNGNPLPNTPHVVERQMIFTCTATWIFDNNEPKCILSPRLLRIPNSSYKILGHIPDISGHGNHGVIHNSAYAEGSGVNEDGSYQFDGVDDFVAIPTLSSGGKQVLMKVNWNTINSIIYDQRGSEGFAIYCSDYQNQGDSITVPAYKGRNPDGTTYIDGIRNEYIIASQLRNVTHNIVEILDTSYAAGNINPIIGKSHMNNNYGSLALYDFMLFDEISTDDKIKELNEYVGIEAKVELPPYYWDTYGKTNSDADRDTIQQRGVAVGDYDLTNYNHAYDKMSGYGGYKFAKFDNTIEWFAEDSSMVVNRNGYLITLKKVPNVAFWRFRNTTLKSLDNPLTFKVKCNKPIDVIFQVKFAKNNNVNIGYNYNIKEVTLVPNESTTIIVPSVSVSDIPEATSILFISVLFDNTSLSDNEEYTVEMLPLYPNGLLYDAVTDYSENVNIPVFTDFTAIMKRKWLKNQGCPLIKGSKVYEGGNGNALLFEWDKAYNFVFYKRTDIMEGEVPDNISFITPTNYNGNVITRGSEQDTNGICIAGDGNAGFANMVFYKLILYPKTIPLLQINFLKNLFERDEIIDLNNPIFKK